MIIFTDIVTGDEIISDSFPMTEVDGVAYEIDCQMVTENAVEVDIGANASAEEAEEGVEDTAIKVNNVIRSFRLQNTSFDKKQYLSYLKGYMKTVKKHLQETGKSDEEVKDFETKAAGFAKKIVTSFKDWEFYTGESMNPDGMVVLLNYREDGTTPYVVVWKHGLKGTKV
ncbi:translationally-controlled tumor protein [Lasiosphaeria ovina]|uniref:Translationally-controlled tumor protein homolog n=1 Tax=Lasiosphaeria ovina TaxID=92902 RepID=A0AAE0TUL1_9PEZI|nr:translationally-controlled tumor protein [Lasiosphaeria ovina]